MGIERIEVGLPTSPISNMDIFELLSENSKDFTLAMQNEISKFFASTGASWRLWRKSDDEPQHILEEATARMLHYIDKKDIKIVLWCSVTKYFAEPSHASIFCNVNGIDPDIAFDVSDGCMGWITSLSIIDKYMKESKGGYALVVSHEFPMGKNGAIYPKSFNIQNATQLKYKLPALTLGEACTLTLIKMDTKTISTGRLEISKGAMLCTLPYRNYKNFIWNSQYIENSEEFHAYYSDMSKIAALKSVSIINKTLNGMDVNLVPHSYTRSFERLHNYFGFNIKIINYFSDYGNTATSSIPLNIQIGHKRSDINYSKPVFAWCASAGMKISISEIHINSAFKLQRSL